MTDKGSSSRSSRNSGNAELASSLPLADALTPEGADLLDAFLRADQGAGTPGCANPDCGAYPHYGVAPHECFYKKGPEYTIGQSTLLPRSEWPDNFVLDLEPGEDPATVQYPGACGVYYCPDCKAGMPADASRSDGATLSESPPPGGPISKDPHHG